MNTENLNKMADHFDNFDGGSSFNMRQYQCCALGISIRVLEGRKELWNFQWVQGASERLFGFRQGTNAGQFLFGSIWVNNPKACAERFRYVARHGDAPSSDQWGRFQFPPKPAVAEAPEVEIEDEELVCV